MSMPLPKYKRQALEKRRAQLIKEYEAASAQRDRALSAVDRLKLDDEIEHLDHEIQQVDEQLDERVSAPGAKEEAEMQSTPAPADEQSNLVKQLHTFVGRLRWLWLTYLGWLAISSLSFIGGLVDVFDLPPCPRLVLFAGLAFLGGCVILGFSILPAHRCRYENWDRGLTTGLWILATGLLAIFAFQACGDRDCPQKNFVYQVQVESKENGQPIEYATVTIQTGVGAPKSEPTDSNGTARFFFGASYMCAPARLSAEAAGYRRVTENMDLVERELPHIVQLELER